MAFRFPEALQCQTWDGHHGFYPHSHGLLAFILNDAIVLCHMHVSPLASND